MSTGITAIHPIHQSGSCGRNVQRLGRAFAATEIGLASGTGSARRENRAPGVAQDAALTSAQADSHRIRLLSSSRWTGGLPDAERRWRARMDHNLARLDKALALPARSQRCKPKKWVTTSRSDPATRLSQSRSGDAFVA